MGRSAAGVRGMRLREGDAVLAMAPASDDDFLLVVTKRGWGKRTPMTAYPTHRRGGQGVITAKVVEERGELAGALVVPFEAQALLVTDSGTLIRMDLADVRPMGRATQGVSLMRAGEDANVVGVARVVDESVERRERARRPDRAVPGSTHDGGDDGRAGGAADRTDDPEEDLDASDGPLELEDPE
jgi:DNA gyrase subunit A